MNEKLSDALSKMFDWQATVDLLHYDFVQQALLAAAILGLLAGAIGPLIISRQMSFAVHGTSELSLTGASAALLAGISVGVGAIVGSVIAAVLFGLLGSKARERDSVIGVIMSFGLGLSVLFMWLYPGRTGTSFSLLVGQIVGVGNSGLQLLLVCAVLVLAVLLVVYRPLLFASTDPEVARARGVPIRALSIVFAVLVGVAAALGVQIVGALLVLSLLITPAAAAARITSSPLRTTVLSIVFAEIAAVGGILLSLAPGVPVSTFVTTISFVIYLICRAVGARRGRGAGRKPVAVAA
ncbi:metal ABC transporter permease [Rhodococcus spelaei]|uniref:Metal ABC transporter permease n=1 Tax=Rhodococcus spelaei TaxID=2546320 RepID=A0A541BRX1_9NOCA|nr:metal ABC transporter permease [Rhodococcus spelaei]TQF75087.1 metal ABC transporter permease [Rhodococcus spelaei]